MLRKRVTSELHDSYFRLMTIKHAIPKIEWAIECGVELLYNSVKKEVRSVGDRVIDQGVVGKAMPGQRGSGSPIKLGSREVADKMQ